jgi:uncharacterized membrane protein
MRLARLFLVAHLAALGFGLMGLLYVIPNLGRFAGDAGAMRVYDFGMTYAGSLHMVFGALAMFAFGVATIGWRRTGIFFACAFPISLGFELIGTGTGYPFGNYAYTEFLGYKVLGHVPFSIPLSWFYVGFASYLLGFLIADRFGLKRVAAWSVGLGVWFLTVWDLVLDPAMAHESLAVKFWVWFETGPYLGMPLQNFVGWSVTGLVFMALARLLWRRDPNPANGLAGAAWFPLVVYIANSVFAMALSASVGLWLPIVLSVVLGVAPALLAWGPGRRSERGGAARPGAGAEGGQGWRTLASR